jgi:CsoR family transcriptional regulator, copper-sensing transcriptional repressor
MSRNGRHAIEHRLARIEGHIHAVHTMAHEGRSYAELVHQISAIRASLDAVVQAIVDDLVSQGLRAAAARDPTSPLIEEIRAVVASAL